MIIVLVGKTCSGKDTIAKELCNTHGLKRIVTYTTRPPRDGEEDGVDYHFVTDSEFDKLEFEEVTRYTMANGLVVRYGSLKTDYMYPGNAVIILNPEGLGQVSKNKNVRSVYLLANDKTIRERLRRRGDSKEEAERRIKADAKDFRDMPLRVNSIVYNNLDYDIKDVAEKVIGVLNK